MKLSVLSILGSFTNICCQLWINSEIADRFQEADGKTQALFGLVVETEFFYRNYYYLLVALALILAIMSYRKNESKNLLIYALLLCVASMFANSEPLWKIILLSRS